MSKSVNLVEERQRAVPDQARIGAGAMQFLLCTCLVILSTGCQERSFHSAEALQSYLDNQRESSVVERGNYRLRLQRMQPERLLLNEYRDAEALIAEVAEPYRSQVADSLEQQLALRGAELASVANFSLAIERVDGKDLVYASLQSEGYEAYSAWLQELLFGLEEHLVLKTSHGTPLDPAALHMERTYGTLSSRTFFLGFQIPDSLLVTDWDKSAYIELGEFGLSTGRLQLPVPSGSPTIALRLQ